MLISPSDTPRVISVQTFSSDADVYIFTSCPGEEYGSSQVRISFDFEGLRECGHRVVVPFLPHSVAEPTRINVTV